MNSYNSTIRYRKAYTLLEIIVVITMVSMVMITIVSIYSQVSKAAARVNQAIGDDNKALDVLQLIAEDIDSIASTGTETQIKIRNKTQKGVRTSQMEITTYVYDSEYKKQVYESVTWRSYFDEFDGLLYLYRSHGGIALENALFDKMQTFRQSEDQKAAQERLQNLNQERFVPICSGMTLFEFSVPGAANQAPRYSWTNSTMPKAVTASISFADPIEDIYGDFIIPADKIYTRTVATDRTRNIAYKFVRQDFEIDDPNLLFGGNIDDPNSVEDIMNILNNTDENQE